MSDQHQRKPFGAKMLSKSQQIRLGSFVQFLMSLKGLAGLIIGTFGANQIFRLRDYSIILGEGNTTRLPWMAAAIGFLVIITSVIGVSLIMQTRPVEDATLCDSDLVSSSEPEDAENEEEDEEEEDEDTAEVEEELELEEEEVEERGEQEEQEDEEDENEREIEDRENAGQEKNEEAINGKEENDPMEDDDDSMTGVGPAEMSRVAVIRRLWLYNVLGFIVLLILFAFLGAVIYWFHIQEERLEARVTDKFAVGFLKNVKTTRAVHRMHYMFECCGVRGPFDFFRPDHSHWLGLEYTPDFLSAKAYIPFSCCNQKFSGKCHRHNETIHECYQGNPGDYKSVTWWSKCGVNTAGCAVAMSDFVKHRLYWLIPPLAIAAVLQLVILVLYRYYQTASVMYVNQPDDRHAFGYLCGSANTKNRQYFQVKPTPPGEKNPEREKNNVRSPVSFDDTPPTDEDEEN